MHLRIGHLHLDDCLWPNDHGILIRWLEKQRQEARLKTATKSEGLNWMDVHQEFFLEHDLVWPPRLDLMAGFSVNVEFLPRREQECAWAYVHLNASSQEETSHDLNMSLDWLSRVVAICVCLVCSSCVWLSKRCRLLHGFEALRLQGFPIHLLHEDRLTSKKAMHMAGNAFNGFVYAAIMVSAMMHLPWPGLPQLEPPFIDLDMMEPPSNISSDDAEGATVSPAGSDVSKEDEGEEEALSSSRVSSTPSSE